MLKLINTCWPIKTVNLLNSYNLQYFHTNYKLVKIVMYTTTVQRNDTELWYNITVVTATKRD